MKAVQKAGAHSHEKWWFSPENLGIGLDTGDMRKAIFENLKVKISLINTGWLVLKSGL